MSRRFRRGFTTAEKTEMWDRWQRGESLSSIGRAFSKDSSSIIFQLSPYGGVRPAPRRRSRLALRLLERETIFRGIVARQSIRSIARQLDRSPSTVSREIKRNGSCDRYRAAQADEQAWSRSRRPKLCKLATRPWLRQTVVRKLTMFWSPEQIAGWLKRRRPGQEDSQVSHETIYCSLFVQARGVLKKELMSYLRSQRTMRRPGPKVWPREQIKDVVSISERPASVEDRAVPGHWPLGDASITCRLTGRGSPIGTEQQLHRHPGGAPNALCDASESGQQGNENGDIGAHQAIEKAAERAL